jgi:hypothetical protein
MITVLQKSAEAVALPITLFGALDDIHQMARSQRDFLPGTF